MNDEFYVGLSNAMMLLILAVTGNFVAETLSCKTQYALTNNMYLKHLVILFMIYFTLNFTTDDNPHPKRALKNAIIIWVLFVLFGKTTPNFTITIAALLIIIYILKNLREHYKHKIKNKQKSKHLDNKLLQLQSKLLTLALVLIFIGSFLYMNEKRHEYGAKFDIFKFIFGVTTCKSLK